MSWLKNWHSGQMGLIPWLLSLFSNADIFASMGATLFTRFNVITEGWAKFQTAGISKGKSNLKGEAWDPFAHDDWAPTPWVTG